jgi:hypothetical protein
MTVAVTRVGRLVAGSDAKRPVIPIHFGHWCRRKPATDADDIGHPFRTAGFST